MKLSSSEEEILDRIQTVEEHRGRPATLIDLGRIKLLDLAELEAAGLVDDVGPIGKPGRGYRLSSAGVDILERARDTANR